MTRINEIGTTYTADHAQQNNSIAESALDHLFLSIFPIFQT